jgi:signal peptidase II
VRHLQTARGAPLIDSSDDASPDLDAEPPPAQPTPAPTSTRNQIRWLAAVALLVVSADLATKFWVVEVLGEDREVRLFGGYVVLHQVRNAGAAFGIATGSTIVFTAVAAGVLIAIARTSRRLRSLPWAIDFGLLAGGAAGNLIDRIARSPGVFTGHVVDWIDLGPGRFYLFNVADSAIVIGGCLAVLLAMRGIELDGSHRHDHAEDAG